VLLNRRVVRLLIEAAEDAGIPRRELLAVAGMVEEDLIGDRASRFEWATLVMLVEDLARHVDGDEERLRDIGRRMSRVPSYDPLRRVAGAMVSVRRLYEIANRWVVPANFPHLRFTSHFAADGRLHMRAEIPPSYAPCAAFFHISQGSIPQLPTLIGLPPAVVVERRVTPRVGELVLSLPRSGSPIELGRRAIRAMLGAPSAVAVLEEQRRDLAEGIAALQAARDELRVVLDRLPDIVIVHAAGTIMWANQAFLTALGLDGYEALGTRLVDLLAERSRAMFGGEMPEVASLTEVVFLAKDGREVTVEIAPTQAVSWGGVPARLVIARDVTERARMQQRLVIADRLASVGLLAAGVAHEINNPLAYVLNNIEIARRGLAPSESVSRGALSIALEGVDRIRTIVRDLLLLSRGDDGVASLVDLAATVSSTLELAAGEIERTTRLVREIGMVPLVSASEQRVAQILLNLIANALEAMRDRSLDENELLVRVAQTHDRVLLEVSDTGRGISPSDLPRIFEPFYTTKPAGQGTGLGLAITQRLVGELRGEIRVTSTPGRGTTFQVYLPAGSHDAK
jgi:PAS domain S-box-containing protein